MPLPADMSKAFSILVIFYQLRNLGTILRGSKRGCILGPDHRNEASEFWACSLPFTMHC